MFNSNLQSLNFGIYVRVSNENQVERGQSLEWQEEKLTNFINNNNLNLKGVFVEPGISGDEFEKRKSLQNLLANIKENKIDCILVYRIDRLVRNMDVGVKIAQILKDNKCLIYSDECGLLDLNTPFGEQQYYNLVVTSLTEVNVLGSRIAEGKRKSASKGFYINSYSVYGYDFYYDSATGDRLLKINDYESQNICNIYSWFQNGLSEFKIAKKLTDLEIPTKRNGNWKPSTVHSILTNQLYIGKIVYGLKKELLEIFDGLHEPIIDGDIFLEVQAMIEKRKNSNQKKKPSDSSYFSSILICSNCGSKMIARQTKSKAKTSIRYYCKSKCGKKSIKHSEAELLFQNYISDNLNIKISESDLDKIGVSEKIEKIDNKISKYKNKVLYVENCFSEGCFGVEEYNKQLGILNKKIIDLEKNRQTIIDNSIQLNPIDKELIKNTFSSFANIWNQINSEYKKNFIERFITEILSIY